MKYKRLLTAFLLLLNFSLLQAQGSYFQQDIGYVIKVRLDDQAHMLRGSENIVYRNNSPDTLTEIYMHLWPNAYKDNSSAFARQKREGGSKRFIEAPKEKRGFIDSLAFVVGKDTLEWENWEGHPDVAILKLARPLAPGGNISIFTPFRVKIPASFSRLGHIGQQYQLCQWYPKPAVYDREGWHPMPYLDQGEFYSEFGSFDVAIEVPKNYVVGATGDLSPNDPEWAWLKKREAQSRAYLAQELEEAPFKPEFPEGEYKTLRFRQKNVHDFAWFCDKTYYILADTVKLPDSGKPVRCVALFNHKERELWQACPKYIAQSVFDYSKWNGDYPYAHATAVDGALSAGAGMEYPNITVLGAGGSAQVLERVTMHEVGHNWYYGILGSNERRHPWMDEGLNSYFEERYWEERHGGESTFLPQALLDAIDAPTQGRIFNREAYRFLSAEGLDQAIGLSSEQYLGINYGLIVYQKSALTFRYLEAYLGRKVIDECFRNYFNRWKFRHPQPADIEQVFEAVSGKDLDWFFKGYLPGKHQLDFRIKQVKNNTLTLQNKVDIPLPAPISLLNKDGEVTQTIWTEPFTGETEITLPENEYQKLKVDAEKVIPEFRLNNNSIARKGILRRARKPRLALGYKYPDPERFTLNFLPSIGFNTTDGFMAGLLVHHGFVPKNRFEFHAMPMYGFESKRLVGSAGFTRRWTPSKFFRKIELHSKFSSFSTFARNKTFLEFYLRKKEARSPRSHKISLISQILAVRGGAEGLAPDNWYLPVYGAATWEASTRGLYANLETKVEIGGNAAEKLGRVSAEAEYERKIKKSEFGLRGFVGAIVSEDPAPYLLQYRVSGSADPFGENILLDRAGETNWLSNQVVRDHGGFSSLTGRSFDQALLALNADWKSPFPLLSVFGDLAYGIGSTANRGNQGYYGAGLRLNFFREVFTINLPVVSSVDQGLPDDFDAFIRGINFSFQPLRFTKALDVSGL